MHVYTKDGALSIEMTCYNNNFRYKKLHLRCCRDPRFIHAKGKNRTQRTEHALCKCKHC